MCLNIVGGYAPQCDMLPLHPWLVLSAPDVEGNSAEVEAQAPLPCDRLFAASIEPVLLIDAVTGIIVQANPCAAGLLRTPREALIGTHLLAAFEASSAPDLERSLAHAGNFGSADTPILQPRSGGPALRAQLSVVRAPPESYFLLRLASDCLASLNESAAGDSSAVFEGIDGASVGFLIADSEFRVDYANRSFVAMVHAKSPDDVRGKSLLRWLPLTAADLSRLRTSLSERHASILITASLHPDRHLSRRVELCAVPVPDGPDTCWGFTVRNLPRLH